MDITTLFCNIDDFWLELEPHYRNHLLSTSTRRRYRKCHLSMSEIMTILVLFHQSHYRHFKAFYIDHLCAYHRNEFPGLVSYNRFVELIPSSLLPLVVYLYTRRLGSVTGLAFIDSTPIQVCHNRRIHSHRVFADSAERGKCSMGWFYGFKLHLIINDEGELLSCAFTAGNVDDRNPKVIDKLTTNMWGKLCGDRGYISQKLFDSLWERGIHLITKIKKNMKNKLMPIMDKVLLRKRAIIESVNDQLKNISQIEHTRHRSPVNFMVNLIAGLIAYTWQPKKPSLNIQKYENALVPLI